MALALAYLPAAPALAAQPMIGFIQLTHTNPAACPGGGSFYPSIDATGKRIAFTSWCDLVPGGNSDGNSDLFVMNANGTGLQQLTFTTGGIGVFQTSLDPSGQRIVVASDRDLVPGGNGDGNNELFGIKVDGTGLVQITHTTGGNGVCGFGNGEPRFDPTGQKILFDSDRDLVPGGNPDGNGELFMMNANGTGLVQLTSSTGGCGSGEGSLDITGTKVLFESDRDLVPGGNADGNYELFRMNVDGSDLVQLTSTVNPAGFGHVASRWTPDTQTIVFRGDGADGISQQLFRMKGDGTGLVQMTWQTDPNFILFTAPWGITPDGKTISVASFADLVPGRNTDLNGELYLVRLRP